DRGVALEQLERRREVEGLRADRRKLFLEWIALEEGAEQTHGKGRQIGCPTELLDVGVWEALGNVQPAVGCEPSLDRFAQRHGGRTTPRADISHATPPAR